MISKRDTIIMDRLFRLAQDVEPVASARIVAGIKLTGNRFVYGFNSNKSSVFQKRFGKNEMAIYNHAEISAIKNVLSKYSLEDLKGSTMYVARAKIIKEPKTRKSSFVRGMAKPCGCFKAGCQMAIHTFDISRVVYSLDDTGEEEL